MRKRTKKSCSSRASSTKTRIETREGESDKYVLAIIKSKFHENKD
jgi:hypothetical protein